VEKAVLSLLLSFFLVMNRTVQLIEGVSSPNSRNKTKGKEKVHPPSVASTDQEVDTDLSAIDTEEEVLHMKNLPYVLSL
jgi:hypothetical protein